MANSSKLPTNQQDECNEDDKELQIELENLVQQIIENDPKVLPKALDDLKQLIQKSIKSTILTIPKVLKHLSPNYNRLKQQYELINDQLLKKHLSDIISILSLVATTTTTNDKQSKTYDCLNYCLKGSGNLLEPNWYINEYIRQLEYEIVDQWYDSKTNRQTLLPLIKQILKSNSRNNDHIHTCDLLTEINQLELFDNYITKDNYYGITIYLKNCRKYVDNYEFTQIQNLLFEIYKKFNEYCQALIIAIQMNDTKKIENLYENFQNNPRISYQMAFICARHLYQFNLPNLNDDKIRSILDNNYLNQFYIEFGRDLDVLEPKTPQDIYKNLNNHSDICSARENLAASFVNGFVNVGFGTDKLLTNKNSNNWIYKNKDYGIMSTVATIGLLYLWDIDNGLLEIDKYLYTNDKFVKYGAILAIGIINCRIKNECDPALALLNDYIANDNDDDVVISAIFGIGLAYARTNRLDIIDLLLKNIGKYQNNWKIFSTTTLMCGLISLGYRNDALFKTITNKLAQFQDLETTKSPFLLLTILGVSLCYYGSKELVEIDLKEPIKSIFEIVLKMCSYATSGDVLIIQQLLKIIEKPINDDSEELLKKSLSILAIAIIVQNDDIGIEMIQRILTQISNYSNDSMVIIRKTIPLAISLLSISDPKLNLITILLKYCHDINDEIACNGIFSLGIIGAGTNNPRLLKILKQLSIYHQNHRSLSRDTFELLMMMIRIVHGLICMGKGTVTLNPRHTDQQLYDPLSIIGILIPMFLLLIEKSPSFLLLKQHYFLFTIALSIQPKWLLILNEDLQQLHMNVRIGDSIDIVGKVGMCTPKTIIGTQQQTTPILLNVNEKVELIPDNCSEIADTNLILDGICILEEKKN